MSLIEFIKKYICVQNKDEFVEKLEFRESEENFGDD